MPFSFTLAYEIKVFSRISYDLNSLTHAVTASRTVNNYSALVDIVCGNENHLERNTEYGTGYGFSH